MSDYPSIPFSADAAIEYCMKRDDAGYQALVNEGLDLSPWIIEASFEGVAGKKVAAKKERGCSEVICFLEYATCRASPGALGVTNTLQVADVSRTLQYELRQRMITLLAWSVGYESAFTLKKEPNLDETRWTIIENEKEPSEPVLVIDFGEPFERGEMLLIDNARHCGVRAFFSEFEDLDSVKKFLTTLHGRHVACGGLKLEEGERPAMTKSLIDHKCPSRDRLLGGRQWEATILTVTSVTTESAKRQCAACQKGNSRKICSRCRSARYCSTECQRTDWKVHKQTCFDQSTASP